jgi:hypothetical protein
MSAVTRSGNRSKTGEASQSTRASNSRSNNISYQQRADNTTPYTTFSASNSARTAVLSNTVAVRLRDTVVRDLCCAGTVRMSCSRARIREPPV